MKLSSLMSLIALTLTAATPALAVGSANHSVRGEGLMECGRYYYKASLTRVESGIFEGPQAIVNFENAEAQALCGGEQVNTDDVGDSRGNVLFGNYKMPRFMNAKSVASARAELFDNRSYRKGGTYNIACKGNLYAAKALDVREAGYSLISFQFADATAEALCGNGRYQQIRHVLREKFEVEWKALGY